jgi:glutathione peroxidase
LAQPRNTKYLKDKEMKKYIALIALIVMAALLLTILTDKQKKAAMITSAASQSAHDFSLIAIDGAPMPMAAYKGKAVLLVNTASFCGFTKQYDGLQKLYESYSAQGFTVIGVPSGDFGGQEHADNKQIKEFCESKFNIRFPMAEKAVVKGDKAIPLFKWAAASTASPPEWNFHKYLIGRDGKVIAAYGSRTAPDAAELKIAIEKALAAKAG